MLRRALAVAAMLVVLFHAWLLAGHAWQGQLSEPGLLLRWVVAGGLLFGWVRVRRQRDARLYGRKAVAIWVLALLLHGPALAGRMEYFSTPPLPAVAATLTQVAGLAAAFGWALLLVLGHARNRTSVGRRLLGNVAPRGITGARVSDLRFLVAPRPPPHA